VRPDGRVAPDDVDDVALHLVGLGPAGVAVQMCSLIGNLACDVRDLAVLRRVRAGSPPAILPVCAAQP
jgi:hypothetical protein